MMKKTALNNLRQARRDDLAGKFKPWKPRHLKIKRPARKAK
jgi:hypothetical protein